MALNPSNSSILEQLALKGLIRVCDCDMQLNEVPVCSVYGNNYDRLQMARQHIPSHFQPYLIQLGIL